MRAYGFIVLFCLSLFGAPPARAADVFDRLQNEPVTMFDFGIKRLRTIVLQAARKIVLSSDPVPQSSVAFDSEKREIRIGYIIRSSAPVLGMATCQERRALAIKEVFNVGLTAYSGQVSEQQRVSCGWVECSHASPPKIVTPCSPWGSAWRIQQILKSP